MRAIITCYSDDDSDFVINDLLCIKPFVEKLRFKTYLLLKNPPPPDLEFPGASYILVNKMNYRSVLHKLCTQGSPERLFLYFSCHSTSQGILIEETSLRVDDILKRISSEVFCIFDCCKARAQFRAQATKGFVIFYSCDVDQACGIIKINSKSYSLFTKILIDELLEQKTPINLVIDKINKRVGVIKSRLKFKAQTASSCQETFFNWLL